MRAICLFLIVAAFVATAALAHSAEHEDEEVFMVMPQLKIPSRFRNINRGLRQSTGRLAKNKRLGDFVIFRMRKSKGSKKSGGKQRFSRLRNAGKKIRNGFKSAGQKIRGGFKKAGQAISNGAKAAGKFLRSDRTKNAIKNGLKAVGKYATSPAGMATIAKGAMMVGSAFGDK